MQGLARGISMYVETLEHVVLPAQSKWANQISKEEGAISEEEGAKFAEPTAEKGANPHKLNRETGAHNGETGAHDGDDVDSISGEDGVMFDAQLAHISNQKSAQPIFGPASSKSK